MPNGAKAVLFDYFDQTNSILPFDEAHPFVVTAQKPQNSTLIQSPSAACFFLLNKTKHILDTVSFGYYVVCPLLSNGWVFLGESSKYVVASKQRFTRMSIRDDDQR